MLGTGARATSVAAGTAREESSPRGQAVQQRPTTRRGSARQVPSADVRDIALDVADIWPDYQPTRLIELPALARLARVRCVLVENGMRAAARQLQGAGRHGGGAARDGARRGCYATSRSARGRPAVAGARLRQRGQSWPCRGSRRALGRDSRDGLPFRERESCARAARIEALGARIIWTPGTYDDAVAQAARDDGLRDRRHLRRPDDPVVRDVMDGYSLIARELAGSLSESGRRPKDEVQRRRRSAEASSPGVGAEAGQLCDANSSVAANWRDAPHAALHAGWRGAASRVLVVEPRSRACLRPLRALPGARAPVRVDGELRTGAEMLACGLASAPAVRFFASTASASVLVDGGASSAGGEAATRG